MNKKLLGTSLLLLIGCNSASAYSIDSSDDLHCAVVTRTLERNADQLGATPAVKRDLYVLQTWYFSKFKRERLAEAPSVFAAMKSQPDEVAVVGRACSTRAFSDPGFSRWQSIASDDYDRKAKQ